MPTVRRSDFIARNRGRELSVAAARSDTTLAALKVEKADLNGDGYVRGDREMDALFSRLDDFDVNGDRHSVNASAGTRVLDLLTSLQRKTQAATVAPAPGTFGDLVGAAGARILAEKTKAHRDAVAATGIGTHYGDHSAYAALSDAEKRAFIDAHKTPGTTPPVPRESSCIGWALENVGAAYAAAGKGARWAEIERAVVRNGSKGTDLAKELQKDGWKAVYWNPDVKTPADGSAEHTYSAHLVRQGQPYYGIAIDGQVLNYRPTPGSATALDTSGLDKLAKVPFFFGVARGGMHTFVGTRAEVNDLHWSDDPTSATIIEQAPLKDFPWLSGAIMVPPGSW